MIGFWAAVTSLGPGLLAPDWPGRRKAAEDAEDISQLEAEGAWKAAPTHDAEAPRLPSQEVEI
jgi:hypothetical protein